MSITHLLDDFSDVSSNEIIELSELKLEEERLEAFEKGYQAGWDDSTNSRHSETDEAARRISQQLDDWSFTYHEAHANALKSLGPVIRQLVDTVLPHVARRMIGPQISELIQDMVAEHGHQPITLSCAPDDRNAVEHLETSFDALPLEVMVNPDLSIGQVEVRFGTVAESELDLSGVMSGVSSALDAFFETQINRQKETA